MDGSGFYCNDPLLDDESSLYCDTYEEDSVLEDVEQPNPPSDSPAPLEILERLKTLDIPPAEMQVLEALLMELNVRAKDWFTMSGEGTVNEHAASLPQRPMIEVRHSKKARFDPDSVHDTMASRFASRGGASRKLPIEREVEICEEEMNRIEKILRKNPIARMAIDLLIDYVIGGGITVTMDFFGEKIQLTPEMKELFSVEWSQRFLRSLLTSWLYYGFCATRLVQSNVIVGEAVPTVIERCTYKTTMIISFSGRREYRIHPIDWPVGKRPREEEDDEYAGDGGTRAKKPPRGPSTPAPWEGDSSVTVYVYPGSEPNSDGTINSPLSTVLSLLIRNEHADRDNQAAGYWGARPIPVLNTGPAGAVSAPDVVSTAPSPDNKLAAHHRALKTDDTEWAKETARATVNNTARLVSLYAQRDAAEDAQEDDYPPNPFSTRPPFRVSHIPAPGQSVTGGPIPVFNPHAVELRRMMFAIIANVLKMPSQMIATDQAMHAANAEFNMQMFDMSISTMQSMIRPVLADLFKMAYKTDAARFRHDFTQGVVERLADKDPADKGPEAELAGEVPVNEAVEKHFKSTGEPNQSGPLLGPEGKPAKDFMPTFEKKIDATKLHDYVDKNIRFAITFQRTPLTTYAVIKQAFDDDFISFETASKIIGQVLHLPPELMLSEAAHKAQKTRKAKMEADAQGMVTKATADATPGAAKPGAKPKPKAKAKPAASKEKSSASKSSDNPKSGKKSDKSSDKPPAKKAKPAAAGSESKSKPEKKAEKK